MADDPDHTILPDGTEVVIEGADSEPVTDPATGATIVTSADGSVEVDLSPSLPTPDLADSKFGDNLVDLISDDERNRLVSVLLEAIENDERSRSEWLETRAKGLELLGFKIEEPRGDTGASTSPVEGQSVVRHPLLAEAVIRFQSNASAELLPTEGPVKVRNDSPPPPTQQAADAYAALGHNGGPPLEDDGGIQDALDLVKKLDGDDDDDVPTATAAPSSYDMDELAFALEKDLNWYLTQGDKGYRADTDRMLFSVGFGGCAFKKVYGDPIRRMPISRSVDARDLIVSNEANDLEDAGRVTHRIMMRKSTIIRMQLAGVYRKVGDLGQPQFQANAIDQKAAAIQGFNSQPQRPEDQPFTIYECHTEWDLAGFEHKDKDGKPSGLQLPYKVSIEKDGRHLLEVRRNWREDDEQCMPRRCFVKYPFIPSMLGFYDIGLLQVLGNATRALTAAWRLMLDAGMFACFPGFLYADVAGRQTTNEFRVPPGGGQKIQTGGRPIDQVVSRLPYNDVTPGLAKMVEMVEQTAQRAGGTAEISVGEGRQDAPVGTTLALLEQATKMLAAVHIRLHAAQAEEFQLLKDRFREDPTALWRHNKRPARQWEVDEFLAALNDCDITPMADPNTPSKMHRIMQAVAVKQLQAVAPQLYDAVAVDTAILKMIGISNPYSLFNKNPQAASAPPPEPPDPTKIAEASIKAQAVQNEAAAKMAEQKQAAVDSAQQHQQQMGEIALESQDRAADRESRERVATIRAQTARETLQHQSSQQDAQRTHEAGVAQGQQQHEATMAAGGQVHEMRKEAMGRFHDAAAAETDRAHQDAQTEASQQHEAQSADAQREHEAAQAKAAAAKPAAARADGGAVTTPVWPRVI